jgi:beta-mannanase
VRLEIIENFEQMVGKHQAIIASSSYWGQQSFPAANLNLIWRHGSLPVVFWSPWDKPYKENCEPDRFSLDQIINGTWDGYIEKWADAAREFGHPMIVAFGVEMNGNWFPWSGWYNGFNYIEDVDDERMQERKAWAGPEKFKAAYRYVVDHVRARGATNIKWMFHANNYSWPNDAWNLVPSYYPGAAYVDWLGLSVYGPQSKNEANPDVPSLVDWPYQEICGLDPKKPIMIAEWGNCRIPLSNRPK